MPGVRRAMTWYIGAGLMVMGCAYGVVLARRELNGGNMTLAELLEQITPHLGERRPPDGAVRDWPVMIRGEHGGWYTPVALVLDEGRVIMQVQSVT